MTYDPTAPNKRSIAMTDGQMAEAMSNWTQEMHKAALAEGWDLWDSRGSFYGGIQIQRIDSPDEFVPPCPTLDTDDDAILIVMRGKGEHHAMARTLVLQWNPEEYDRMLWTMDHAPKWFQVQITIPIRAHTSSEATDIAIGACEHLQDTFNDDGSIGSLVHIEVVPSPTVGEKS